MASCTPSFCSTSLRIDSSAAASTMCRKPSEGPDGGLAGLNLSAVNLMGRVSERPEEFVHGERRIHRVRALFHASERLLVRHPRSRDSQTDRLARPQSDVEEGPRHDRHERLVVEGLPLNHRPDGHGPVDVRAFEEPLDREGNLERAGDADHGRHPDASLLRAREGRGVLGPWDGVALQDEAASLLPKLVDRGRGYVVPGERCVDDSDSLQAFRLRRGAGGSAGTSTLPRSTSDSRSWSASHSATFLTIFRVPSRSPSNFGSRTTFVESPRFRHSSRIRFSSWTWSKPMATTSGRISSKMS